MFRVLFSNFYNIAHLYVQQFLIYSPVTFPGSGENKAGLRCAAIGYDNGYSTFFRKNVCRTSFHEILRYNNMYILRYGKIA